MAFMENLCKKFGTFLVTSRKLMGNIFFAWNGFTKRI